MSWSDNKCKTLNSSIALSRVLSSRGFSLVVKVASGTFLVERLTEPLGTFHLSEFRKSEYEQNNAMSSAFCIIFVTLLRT